MPHANELTPGTPPNLVLVGFMGSGKTATGKLAAKALGFQFLDTDQLIVDRARRQIPDIFASEGEAYFRELETGVIVSLGHLRRCVIATGGGAVLSGENRRLLRALGFVVCLKAREEVLFERVSRNEKRPLLQTENPLQTLRDLLAKRAEAYAEAAHWSLDTSDMGHPAVVDAVVSAVRDAFAWNKKT
jgi:shikimate kinase